MNDEKLLSAREVAGMLKIHIKTFYGLLKRPEGEDFPKAISFGERTHRWRKSDVEKWIAEKAAKAAEK